MINILKKIIFEKDIDNRIYQGETYNQILSWLNALLLSGDIENLLYASLKQYLDNNYKD